MTRTHTIRIPGSSAELESSLSSAADLIHAHDRFLVTAHEGPDGDAIGATLGMSLLLTEMGKTAIPYLKDGVPYNFQFLSGSEHLISDPEDIPDDIEVIAILDCSSLTRVDTRLATRSFDAKVLCVDHHQTVDAITFDVFVHDPTASSVGEILYRLVHELQTPLTPPVAECLYTSIYTDTGGFRYQNTTEPALSVSAQLVAVGVDVWKITSEVYENHPEGRVRLLGEVLRTLRLSSCGRLAFLTVTQDMYHLTQTGPEMLDGFINYARGIRGVEVAGQLREISPERYRVSFRSRGKVNVAELAQRFNGGGHHNAAGCTVSGQPDQIIEQLSLELNQILQTTEASHQG